MPFETISGLMKTSIAPGGKTAANVKRRIMPAWCVFKTCSFNWLTRTSPFKNEVFSLRYVDHIGTLEPSVGRRKCSPVRDQRACSLENSYREPGSCNRCNWHR